MHFFPQQDFILVNQYVSVIFKRKYRIEKKWKMDPFLKFITLYVEQKVELLQYLQSS